MSVPYGPTGIQRKISVKGKIIVCTNRYKLAMGFELVYKIVEKLWDDHITGFSGWLDRWE